MSLITVKSDNGTLFKLLSKTMTEMHSGSPYITTREHIKEAFAGRGRHITMPYIIHNPFKDYYQIAHVALFNGGISIGCMVFSGDDFKTLKKWATPEVKHARTRR